MESRDGGSMSYERYTVAVVCAMSMEMSAVRYMLDKEHPRLQQKQGDFNTYLAVKGKGSAATVANNLARTFPAITPRFLIGIGGGVPSERNDIPLGDVVVSMPNGEYGSVVQYGPGKETDGGFVLKGFLWPPPPLLRSAVENMRSDHLVSDNRIEELKQPTCDQCDHQRAIQRQDREFPGPQIHYGLIAFGDRVMRTTNGTARTGFGGVPWFEMETAGLMTEYSCIIIRDISDYANSHKNDGWLHYTAAKAAACTKELLSYLQPGENPLYFANPSTSRMV
ncbi:uncharacterized protein TRIVIDRAFT_192299 [Trichoderma virens Gv29-8]|uniref:Nucleoside phosphorylase domain-containing protein n=1 Tax=Hypocrea virens (strain Gv29-8 / FGSC 10586) TaxID=413071 RepID=G9MWE6_HYPVG|nr:uncharacterized protein TRIVIDRAFT_192299 [Trichoderma virens Gv29-8]EHK21282.1 hypothetical protein TRIVIDRAFT_192299 [Trichoderma virens Gv29-8]UKZ52392.1 hypothetical protein TrVGV298_006168 [Trichoderma virens]